MTNTEIPRQLIQDALDNANTAAEIYDGYSGRGMYGATCFGITFEERDGASSFFVALGMALQRAEDSEEYEDEDFYPEELAFELARKSCTDSMGMSSIVYFPGYALRD